MPDISPVVAVIQARMSSSRLPGKVLMPIAGKPLLWHIVHRLRKCRTVDKIAVATSIDPRDDAIAEFCSKEGITCVRGSLPNVLDRYRLAAEQTGAKTLLRVTGDSPLIDPGFVDYLVGAIAERGGDFAVLEPGALCAHEGVDVFSRHALDWLIDKAGDDPIAREHVTSYFKLHPEGVKVLVLPAYPPLARRYGRLSVDTADDLTMVRALYERFGAEPGELKLADALELMSEDPSLRQINAHVRQKTLGQVERHALICCQAGHKAGLGHLRRSLSLARALRDRQGFGVLIGIHGDQTVAELVRAASFEAVMLEQPGDLQALASSRNFSLAIVDVKDWLSRADIAALAGRLPIVAVIDDASERRLAASHAYYPPVPQAYELSWEGSACRPRIGWDWCMLGFDPSRATTPALHPDSPPRIVVSMGGADPLNFTTLALEALAAAKFKTDVDVVIGPAFAEPDKLAAAIQKAGFRPLRGVTDLAATFAVAELALVAFGITAYELAALGVPAVYLSSSADQARSASAFAAAGMGESLNVHASAAEIAAAIEALMSDAVRREAMRLAGPTLVNGQGAAHIAADLADALDSPSPARAPRRHDLPSHGYPPQRVHSAVRIERLGLGTVQFGQAYGVSNKRGKIPVHEVAAILARSAEAGISLLDTAANYGAAETVLSGLDTKPFRIVTKTAGLAGGLDAVIARVRQSARNLNIDTVLVHAAADLQGEAGDDLWNALKALRDEDGLFRKLGISVYVSDNPAALAARFRPDVVQLPFSLMDQRLLRDGTLPRLLDNDIEIHARSIFLQGLLFLEKLPEKLQHAAPYFQSLRAQIAEAGSTPLAAALAFVLTRPEIKFGLVGVASVTMLDEILAAAERPLPDMDWDSLALDDELVLTPSLW